ncbi:MULTISPECIES: LytTR family DNA-binding domain-containing protein [unclassified Microcella]|uniref:LytR/AlgR family response regulator transcription factor n=1 Tax=unclassified Microcella TaxID=2630066 RepID=UPI0006FFEC53|nr:MULTISPECIES: response regulator transcription factor [unclassified Microcella]KQV26769.1 LytR family transcriptional regulator [Yonghaparkia sp. Root332]KRF33905.1 LytR family transcriptional regulator [Yonghaparkia sp. Soil809]
MTVLVADDEQPALDELAYLLGHDERIGTIHRASNGADALRILTQETIDAVFLDIHMPGLSGIDLARAVGHFDRRPPFVFVTADEERALEAFDLSAVDYVLKPVRSERLARAVGRLLDARAASSIESSADAPAAAAPVTAPAAPPTASTPALVAVSLGGTTRMIRQDSIQFVQAQGDYARLHTDDGSYLVRVPMSDLERQWSAAGFVRIHRSYLVSLTHVSRLRLGASSPTVLVGGTELPVSRRLLPALRDRVAANRIRPRA